MLCGFSRALVHKLPVVYISHMYMVAGLRGRPRAQARLLNARFASSASIVEFSKVIQFEKGLNVSGYT